MKKSILISLFFCLLWQTIFCQEIPLAMEQQLEDLTAVNESETEDDSYLLQMEHFIRHPVNLNTADEHELRELRMINELQITGLIAYRHLLGKLISLYELQAVPGWDVSLIRKVLPFVKLGSAVRMKEDLRQRFYKGEHNVLFRMAGVLEKARGFTEAKYLGGPLRMYFRYRYTYKNLLQWGILGDKDAGEPFLKQAQKTGFDFYSFHLFIKKAGSIESLAIGDFTVNMGQGLIHWQGQAFGKSAVVMAIKRQSEVLRPYSSAGEYNFSRGLGITLKKDKAEATLFISNHAITASLEEGAERSISSFNISGLHRTATEINARNNVQQLSFGSVIRYNTYGWRIGLNTIGHLFSLPVQKRAEPYNLFALSGKQWYNLSADYSYTYRNIHFFGELAADKNFNKAFVSGALVSIDAKADLSILYRNAAKAYQAPSGNAFTENTLPGNEAGLYTGISIRPLDGWRLDVYADLYRFAWLKYLVDAPSAGCDYLVQLTYTIGKRSEIYSSYKYRSKQGNAPDNSTPTNFLVAIPKQNWRINVQHKISASLTIRSRAEVCWYDKKNNEAAGGYLIYIDALCKPLVNGYSVIARWQYFETDDYNSRVYAYENDVLYSFSIPAFFDKGMRYYLLFNKDLGKKLSVWLRWSQTIYNNKISTGSGNEEIAGNKKSEIKFQLKYSF